MSKGDRTHKQQQTNNFLTRLSSGPNSIKHRTGGTPERIATYDPYEDGVGDVTVEEGVGRLREGLKGRGQTEDLIVHEPITDLDFCTDFSGRGGVPFTNWSKIWFDLFQTPVKNSSFAK